MKELNKFNKQLKVVFTFAFFYHRLFIDSVGAEKYYYTRIWLSS